MKIFILTSALFSVLFTSCGKNTLCTDDNLSWKRTDYQGTQLRTDGCYLCQNTASPKYANICFLFRSGIFTGGGVIDYNEAINGKINFEGYNLSSKKSKAAWGVFKIEGSTIEYETWEPQINGCQRTIYEKGNIINDTTFVITKREFREKGKTIKTEDPNSTFYFKALTQKPDSTNVYVP